MKTKLSLLLCLFFIAFGFSQTQKQIKKTTKNYNKEKLKNLENTFEKSFYSEYNEAIRIAKINGWPISYKEKNSNYHIKTILNGKPIYVKSMSGNAALSTRTNYLHNGGGLGLDLEGQNMNVHVWEVGGVGLVEHNEYDGAGGTDRLSIADGTTELSNHAGQVTGILIASGVNANAKGMAPQASAIGYNHINDLSEAAAAAANGMLLSNHSYGAPVDQLIDDASWIIGAYVQNSKDWDDLMYNAPYYLPVISAGNDGDDETSNSDPMGGNAAYDKLSFDKTSKNPLIVASGSDAIINGDGTLNSITRSSFSSEGPTDDLRIKPDIMGNGETVISSGTANSINYVFAPFNSGTSFSSPNVCGSLLLLQQHHNNLNGAYMKSATLKGLALHTADDLDGAGPDAHSGWGLMNAKVAAETISDNGFSTWISEETLTNGESFSIDVVSKNSTPFSPSTLMASISWTDQGGQINPTGAVNDGIIYSNDATPALVNDLDIRVTQTSNTFTPWKLTAFDTNAQGDNTVDPYERVDISGASGTYTITITHKGTLVGGQQNFSLILTGLLSNFTLKTQTSDQTICSPSDATYNFNYLQTGGATTNFSLSGVPVLATSSVSPTSLNADGAFDVTIGNLANVPADTYNIHVIGDDGNETETRIIKLRVLHPDFTAYPQTLISPANGASTTSAALTLTWSENLNAENYLVEVAANPSFSSILFSGTKTENELNFDVSGLTSETVYYWRVRPDNNCNTGTGNYSETYSFQVGSIDCGNNIFNATDFTDANILETAGDSASVPVTVSTGGLNVDSIETSFEISHTWVNDINITLEGPTSIGSPQVLLFDSSCNVDTGGDTANPGDGDDYDVTFSDSGVALFCDDPAVPSITGTVIPLESLSAFTGLAADGVWTLRVGDPNNGDGGDITAFSVDICVSTVITSIPTFVNKAFEAPLNATYTFMSSDVEATSTAEIASEQVYTVLVMPSVGLLEKSAVAMSLGDTFTQDDINTGEITYSNTETSAFTDEFKVDIKNAANGWLSNQTIAISSTLSVNEFGLGNLNIWPNPANEKINIRLDNLTSNEGITVSLFDIQGRTIKTLDYEITSNRLLRTIELSGMTNGIYLLQIKQGSKKSINKIIID